MTRSQKSPSRREQFNKSIRSKAQTEGITFRDAVTKTKTELKGKVRFNDFCIPFNVSLRSLQPEDLVRSETDRRNPGRNDGVQWNGSQFITNKQLDDELKQSARSEEAYDDSYDFHAMLDGAPQPELTVNLFDLARPAKRRGKP